MVEEVEVGAEVEVEGLTLIARARVAETKVSAFRG